MTQIAAFSPEWSEPDWFEYSPDGHWRQLPWIPPAAVHRRWLIPAPLQQLTFALIVDPSCTRRSRGIGNLIQANPFISVAILDVILETIARCNGAMFHLGLGWIGTCRRIRPYCAQGAAGGACNGSAEVGFKSSEAQVQDSS